MQREACKHAKTQHLRQVNPVRRPFGPRIRAENGLLIELPGPPAVRRPFRPRIRAENELLLELPGLLLELPGLLLELRGLLLELPGLLLDFPWLLLELPGASKAPRAPGEAGEGP